MKQPREKIPDLELMTRPKLIQLIWEKLGTTTSFSNALIKHWPVIENNASWMKVFENLQLNPEILVEGEDIYEIKKDDENYLKCLGYIGILLDHLDRAEPLPTDLYGKCLNLSERVVFF
jgi:hypothetical protein